MHTLLSKQLNIKAVILVIAFIFIINFVNAYDDIGKYRLNEPININLGCSYNNTYCPVDFLCNITIYNKNGVVINNLGMDNLTYPQYNYTLSSSQMNLTGLWYGRQVCCSTTQCADYSFQFEVNAQGKEYGTIQGTIYAIVFALLIGIFGFSMFAFIKIPYKNFRNREGELIKINWKKYLKIFMFAIAYLCLIGISYFAWNISYGILEFTEMANFFNMFYTLLMIMIFPLLLVLFVFGLIRFVQDKNIEKMLTRGLTLK